jgi:peptidoglycan hydrolase-like protein with peptidoglycan-binding domain
MHTKRVRLVSAAMAGGVSAAMAGGLVLTGVTAAAIANTSHAPTRVTLAADTTSSAVNLGNCPTLTEGYHGGCVNQLQTELNADDGDNLPVTGTFGPATRAAVIAFQQEHHIVPAEGTVGPQTKAALDNPGSSSAAPPPGQLNPGQRITSGTQIASPDGRFVLQMQSDGNLVIRAPGNVPLGDTHTAGHDGTIAVMQMDGNFVLRAPGNIPVWSSGTDGHPGTVLQVQDDGGVVLYGPGHQVLRVLFPAALSSSTPPTSSATPPTSSATPPEPLPTPQPGAPLPGTPADCLSRGQVSQNGRCVSDGAVPLGKSAADCVSEETVKKAYELTAEGLSPAAAELLAKEAVKKALAWLTVGSVLKCELLDKAVG